MGPCHMYGPDGSHCLSLFLYLFYEMHGAEADITSHVLIRCTSPWPSKLPPPLHPDGPPLALNTPRHCTYRAEPTRWERQPNWEGMVTSSLHFRQS